MLDTIITISRCCTPSSACEQHASWVLHWVEQGCDEPLCISAKANIIPDQQLALFICFSSQTNGMISGVRFSLCSCLRDDSTHSTNALQGTCLWVVCILQSETDCSQISVPVCQPPSCCDTSSKVCKDTPLALSTCCHTSAPASKRKHALLSEQLIHV